MVKMTAPRTPSCTIEYDYKGETVMTYRFSLTTAHTRELTMDIGSKPKLPHYLRLRPK